MDDRYYFIADDAADNLTEKDTSTERVRRYYRRHPEKVRQYLKKTVKDRVARNRDRRDAVKKYGAKKMAGHDVHHPDGPNGGSWRLADKDHGRDTIQMRKNRRARQHQRKAAPKPTSTPTTTPTPQTPSQNLTIHPHPFKNVGMSFKDVLSVYSRTLGGVLGLGRNITNEVYVETIKLRIVDGVLYVYSDATPELKRSSVFVDAMDASERVKTGVARVLVDIERMLQENTLRETPNFLGPEASRFVHANIVLYKKDVEPELNKVFVVFTTVAGSSATNDKTLARLMHSYQAEIASEKHIAVYFSQAEMDFMNSQLSNIQSGFNEVMREYKLSADTPLSEFLEEVCDFLLRDLGTSEDFTLENDEFIDVVQRWALGESFDLSTLPEKAKTIIEKYEETDLSEDIQSETASYQKVVLSGALYTLSRINNILVANSPHKKAIINTDIMASVKTLQTAYKEGKDVYDLFQQEMRRIANARLDDANLVLYHDKEFFFFDQPGMLTAQIARTAAAIIPRDKTAPTDKEKGTHHSTKDPLRGILTRLFNDKTTIINPETGNRILLKTALGYGPGHPTYKAGREWLKNNVPGIPILRNPNIRGIFNRREDRVGTHGKRG